MTLDADEKEILGSVQRGEWRPARALEEGLPYQTLIPSLLHKYASGRLREGSARTEIANMFLRQKGSGLHARRASELLPFGCLAREQEGFQIFSVATDFERTEVLIPEPIRRIGI